MASSWTLVGDVGTVTKSNGRFIVNIAENKYERNKDSGKFEKVSTVWFQCMSKFKPNVKSGDRVIATGHYIESNHPTYKYMMQIDYIGIIISGKRVL